MIRLSLDASNVQREKIVFELVKPFIPGFSVDSMEVDATSTEDQLSATVSKRKAIETDTATTADEIEMVTIEETPTSKVKTRKNKKSKK